MEEIDDDLFVSKKPKNYIFAEKADQIRDQTNTSLKNSIRALHESVSTGTGTLSTLAEQREQLERAEAGLDSINATTRVTQKHLNSMNSFKSFFAGVFSKKSSDASTKTPSVQQFAPIPKSATVANIQNLSSQYPNAADNIARKSRDVYTASSSIRGLTTNQQKSDTMEDEIENNLCEISDSLSLVKQLALNLGNEIEDQNNMLGRIGEKSERANDSINHQNRQINQILKK